MLKRLGVALIWSEDLNNLLPFYRDVLGLTPVLESPAHVLLSESLESGANGGIGNTRTAQIRDAAFAG